MNIASANMRSPATLPMAASLPVETDAKSAIRQYLLIARRWRYVIIGSVVLCGLLSLIATLLMTPQYTSTTTIEISRESNKVTDIQGVEREAGVSDQEFYQTQYGLLQSRSLSERVAIQLRLVDDPKFFEMYRTSEPQSGFQQVNGRYTAAGRKIRQRVAGEILRRNIGITPARLSRLVDIHFTSPDPAFSAKVANAWANNFIDTNLERKVQATAYGRNLLSRQLAQAKEKLDESQRKLVAYASDQRIINLPAQGGQNGSADERSIVADDLASLNSALSQATTDRIQAQARYQQLGRAGASTEALRNQAINNLRQRRAELAAEYQRLMVQFEPAYPAARAIQSQITQLDRSIAREEERVTGSLQADFREAQEREKALQARVDQLKSNFLDLRRRSIQYNIYQQEVDTNRALYDGLLKRFEEIGVAGGVGINNVSVVDSADVPEKPSSPRLVLNLAFSLLIGLGIGGALAFALEQMDEAFADPAEVQRRLGLPLLGTVPKVEGSTPKEAMLDRKSNIVDAYLAVQTSLAFTTEHGVPRSFAVTSTRPGEGKSTTALALAATLARAHKRVILVDADMRSPSVHHLANVSNDQGLSNFLAGQDDIMPLMFEMADMSISAMAAGPIPPNAAELLTGNRFSLLLERLFEHFDHVVIDSPPVMGLADALLIAKRVEGVVYVVESHGIRSTLVKTALSRLTAAHAHIFGGVLTKFQSRRSHDAYEYGYGYGRDESTSAGARN